MEKTIKRKNIDLPVDVLQKLSMMAVAQGRSLKAYIQVEALIMEGFLPIVPLESPPPERRRGIQEMSEGKGKAFTMDEIRDRLGV